MMGKNSFFKGISNEREEIKFVLDKQSSGFIFLRNIMPKFSNFKCTFTPSVFSLENAAKRTTKFIIK
jgi:hypothetical protein